MSTRSESSKRSSCDCDQTFDMLIYAIKEMQKGNAMMLKNMSLVIQNVDHLTKLCKESGVLNSKTSSARTNSSQTKLDVDETIPQLDGNQSLDTQSEEFLPLSGEVLPQVNLGHTVHTEVCSQTTLDETSDVELSLVQSTGDTTAPRKSRKRRKKKAAGKLSKISQTVQAIHNVAALAGWSEAKLQHELRVFKSKCESHSPVQSSCPKLSKKNIHNTTSNCPKISKENQCNTSKVKEGFTTVVLPPFPHPMNVPPPCLVSSPSRWPLYKVSPSCRVSSPDQRRHLYKDSPPQITSTTQVLPPEKVLRCTSQDRLQTLYFYRKPPTISKIEF
jgi:hypothetical protein